MTPYDCLNILSCDGQCAQRTTFLQIISECGKDVKKMRAGNVGKMWVSVVSGHDGGSQSPDLDENFGTPYSFSRGFRKS